MPSPLATRIKYSALGRLATLPRRARIGFGATAAQGLAVLRWLARSREWANFSYDYTEQGLEAVVCALALLGGVSREVVRGYADELLGDAAFSARYRQRVRETRLRYTSDPQLRYGRCLTNYLLVRVSGARFVFEAGTERGLSTWAMVRALQRAGHAPGAASIVTVDIAADRGELLEGDEGGYVTRVTGDSVAVLGATERPIDLFLHDTTNDEAHSRAQFAALAGRLAPGGWVHSAWFSPAFVAFCDRKSLRCLEYVEQPQGHWYPGRRCAIARA
jgi:predicted O-methyltransferase YrrM